MTALDVVNLFSLPGAWLHTSTQVENFDFQAAAKQVSPMFHAPPEQMEPFMRSVSKDNRALKEHPDYPVETTEYQVLRGNVLEWARNNANINSFGRPVQVFIPTHFLPLLTADLLLHVASPAPATEVARAQTRGPEAELAKEFRSKNDWKALLRVGKASYDSRLKQVAQQRQIHNEQDDKKAELLNYWISIQKQAGTTTYANLRHVRTALSIMLRGDTGISMEGRKQQLQRDGELSGVEFSEAELIDAVEKTNLRVLTAPLFAALAHSPLILIADKTLTQSPFISARSAMLQARYPLVTWRRLGNQHKLAENDILWRIEKTLWSLLFSMAWGIITAELVLERFWDDPDVRDVLAGKYGEAESIGLRYAADEQEEPQPQPPVPAQEEEESEPQPPPRKKPRLAAPGPDSPPAEEQSGRDLRSKGKSKDRPTSKRPRAAQRDVVESWLVTANDRVPYPIPEPEQLEDQWVHTELHLEPRLYALAPPSSTVDIPYWVFANGGQADDPLQATPRQYKYLPFRQTAQEGRILQLIPLLPNIVPSDTESVVFPVCEERWRALARLQRQEVMRARCALIKHPKPMEYDGEIISFDDEGMSAFTNLDRKAFIQDLGQKESVENFKLHIGTPRALLDCVKARKAREGDHQDQRLNLLSNLISSQSLPIPPGWA
ncbi:hypothetical protein FB45DRAFT_1032135 [Roridomyces roridus]|uniref:Uncharacterized protein n=1 Tax=Roridomyces roridus TaxID=1738132 RepID=A0AAD7FIX1_9AGAR|nr:hypothetical protein FB45DRAFT_1032135 [Roridomyces roridus]